MGGKLRETGGKGPCSTIPGQRCHQAATRGDATTDTIQPNSLPRQPARLAAHLLTLLLVAHPACAQTTSIIDRLQPPLVAAHRGGEFGRPNTLVQFAEALRSNDADILELDLRLTSDGKVVVFHDETLALKSDCQGTVEATSYRDLLACKLSNGERIALFSDVLDLVGGTRLISAELKTDDVSQPAARLVQAHGATGWVYFQVGNRQRAYQLVRSVSPDIAMMASADAPASLRWIVDSRDPFLRIVELGRDALSTQSIAALHAQGKLVSVNSWRYQFTEERFSASCDRVFEQGVDIAVTNNPASCHQQKGAWLHRLHVVGEFYDRQHVRVWARNHPDLSWTFGLTLLLAPLWAIASVLRRRTVRLL